MLSQLETYIKLNKEKEVKSESNTIVNNYESSKKTDDYGANEGRTIEPENGNSSDKKSKDSKSSKDSKGSKKDPKGRDVDSETGTDSDRMDDATLQILVDTLLSNNAINAMIKSFSSPVVYKDNVPIEEGKLNVIVALSIDSDDFKELRELHKNITSISTYGRDAYVSCLKELNEEDFYPKDEMKKMMTAAMFKVIKDNKPDVLLINLNNDAYDYVALLALLMKDGANVLYLNYTIDDLFDIMKGRHSNPEKWLFEPLINLFERSTNSRDDNIIELEIKTLTDYLKKYHMYFESNEHMMSFVKKIFKDDKSIMLKPKFPVSKVCKL